MGNSGKTGRFLAGSLMLVILFAAIGMGQAAWAANAVKVRAGVHKGFARIVFDWPTPVTYTTDLGSAHLKIRFSKPLAAKLSAASRHLYRYVTDLAISEDGHSVSMKLLRPVRLRHRRIDGVLAFDLVIKAKTAASKKSGTKTAKQSSGKTAKKAAAKANDARTPAKQAKARPAYTEKVLIRAGEHGKLSRLVFDWRRNVGYSVVLSKGGLSVAFARPATFDLSELQKDPPRFIRGAAAAIDKDGARVNLRTKEGVRFRHFRAGTKIVLDIYAPKKSKKVAKDAKDAKDSLIIPPRLLAVQDRISPDRGAGAA